MTSNATRLAVIEMFKAGNGVRKIVNCLKVPRSTVYHTIKRFKELGIAEDRPRPGRPRTAYTTHVHKILKERYPFIEIMTGMPLVKYDCPACSKQYTSISGLKRHQRSKHNLDGASSTALCDICGKRLSSTDKLKFHRRTHTGYKPFQCNDCPKNFIKKEQLIEHERVHTGEKPFLCKYCGKGFTQRSPLKIHERIHTGERPYVCRLCNKGCISKSVMDTHMKTCDGIPIMNNLQ